MHFERGRLLPTGHLRQLRHGSNRQSQPIISIYSTEVEEHGKCLRCALDAAQSQRRAAPAKPVCGRSRPGVAGVCGRRGARRPCFKPALGAA